MIYHQGITIRNEVIRIGYLSFDTSVKIHYSGRYTSTKTSKTGNGGIAGYIRHIDRGTDRKNGCEVQHSNPDIDSDLTLLNDSYYKDENGEWQETSHSKDMESAIEKRIEFAKEHGARISTKGKNDTVVVRPLVVQLDKDSISEHENTWMWDVIEILEKQFGKENITGFSVHKDETNPHLHICFVPCHETQKNGKLKCSVSQTKFFQNPKQLAGLHRKIRKELLKRNYDVEQENKPIEEHLAGYYDKNGEWHQQGLTPDQLKEWFDRQLHLRMEMSNVMYRQSELDKIEQTIYNLREKAKIQQEELEKERVALNAQQAAFESEKADVQTQLKIIAEETAKAKKMKAAAEEMLEKAYDTINICYNILSEEKHLDDRFLEFVGKQDKKTGKHNRRAMEKWFKSFKEQCWDNNTAQKMEALEIRKQRLKMANRKIDDTTTNTGSTDTGYDFSA